MQEAMMKQLAEAVLAMPPLSILLVALQMSVR